MTAATPGPSGPNLFSMFSGGGDGLYRARRETFLFSMIGQAAALGLLIYFTSCVIRSTPAIPEGIRHIADLPVIFSGTGGGGGGNHDPLPASHGNPPPASLDQQIVPPTVIVLNEAHKLVAPETVMVAPNVPMPQGTIGDPLSKFSTLSNGPGGPGGIGPGCCDGIGPSTGPHVGVGPEGIVPAGKYGRTYPEAIYSPEPSFSEEARKTKQQGTVTLWLVVGADGKTYNIRVGQSLGYGLDEEAIKAVSQWRFKPAVFNGQPVPTQIAVQVDFHLY